MGGCDRGELKSYIGGGGEKKKKNLLFFFFFSGVNELYGKVISVIDGGLLLTYQINLKLSKKRK